MSQPLNFNDATPAAPSGKANVSWQADAPSPDPNTARNISAYLPPCTATTPGAVPTPPNNTTTFLRGDGTFAAPTAGPSASQIQQEAFVYAADSGTANHYVVTLSPAPSIVAGSEVIFKAGNANTVASTLAVNGASPVAIKKNGTAALANGDIVAGQLVTCVYDGTYYQLTSPSSALSVTASAIQQESYTYAADSGTANHYAVTLSPAPTIVAGSEITFLSAHANTGASDLAVNGAGAVAIKKNSSLALVSGDIVAGQMVTVVYDGTYYQLSSPSANANQTMTSTVGGLVPTPPNDATRYLDGTGNFSTPAGGGGGGTAFNFAKSQVKQIFAGAANPLQWTGGDVFTSNAFWALAAPTSSYGEMSQFSPQSAGAIGGAFSLSILWTGRHISISGGIALFRTTDIRFWFGCFNTTSGSSITNSDTTPTSIYAAFRFSSIAGDTHWQAVTRDGTTQNVVSTGISPDTAQHRFGIFFDDANSQIIFYIDGVSVATLTANLPPANTALAVSIDGRWATAKLNPLFGVAFVAEQVDF